MFVDFSVEAEEDSRGGKRAVIKIHGMPVWKADQAFESKEAAESFAFAHLVEQIGFILK